MLKEAELQGGSRLKGVGARIVGEVFLGLLALDQILLVAQAALVATLQALSRTVTMTDLLTVVGVHPKPRSVASTASCQPYFRAISISTIASEPGSTEALKTLPYAGRRAG